MFSFGFYLVNLKINKAKNKIIFETDIFFEKLHKSF